MSVNMRTLLKKKKKLAEAVQRLDSEKLFDLYHNENNHYMI